MNLEILLGESAITESSARSLPPESLLIAMEFTTAGFAHPCGYKESHWIGTGMPRLTVRSNNDEHHYCVKCAKALLLQGSEQLRIFLAGLHALSAS